ncbi:MAG: caspase family protein [Myxococcota bacterium]
MRMGIIRTITFAIVSAALATPALAQTELHRFALVIGANDGGTDRVLLRYAQSDARSVARVISELGGVATSDVEVLLDPDSGGLEAGFARMRDRLNAARGVGKRLELLVYYSGHSDEEGLLLGGIHYRYPQLRAQIQRMPADIKIAILDSCSSGAFTRTKGGTRRPAFAVDEANAVRGHAFLTSSSADEAAQESDRIGASFFTHYLITGLRGGADSNQDSRVTLSEAYQFAFNETVARTEATKHGAQHPAYDMHLIGTGDVVMTDLRSTGAALRLTKDVAGRLFIRDAAGRLVIEMRKVAGAPVVLGLSAARYQVTLDRDERLYRAEVDLIRGRQVALASHQFRPIAAEHNVARGGAPGADPAVATAMPREYRPVAVSVSLVPLVSTSGAEKTTNVIAFNVLAGIGGDLYGAEFGGLLNFRQGDVRGFQAAGLGNINAGSLRGFQAAGLGNINSGDVRGGQVAGLANLNDGWLRGIQAAGLANLNSGSVRGVQAAGITNLNDGWLRGIQAAGITNVNSGYISGIQAAGIANWNDGDTRGGQVAGISNWTDGNVRGLQVAGIANVADSDVRGAQISGISNLAGGHVSGLQLGLVNIGGSVAGAQVGLVNIAQRVSGLQLGLVNVADEHSGLPIGLASLVRDGRWSAELWTSDIAPLSAGLKLGSRHFYTMLAVRGTDDLFMPGLGLGVHSDLGGLYLDIDVAAYGVFKHDFGEADNDMLTELRAMVGLQLDSHLAVFGGVAFSNLIAFDGKPGDELTPLESKVYQRNDVTFRLSPGLFAGIAY